MTLQLSHHDTPGTVATAIFYAGIDPDGHPIPVARTDAARLRQHRLLVPQRRQDGRPLASGRQALPKPTLTRMA